MVVVIGMRMGKLMGMAKLMAMGVDGDGNDS